MPDHLIASFVQVDASEDVKAKIYRVTYLFQSPIWALGR